MDHLPRLDNLPHGGQRPDQLSGRRRHVWPVCRYLDRHLLGRLHPAQTTPRLAMAYIAIPDKARKEPLGFAGLNRLYDNLVATLESFRAEHNDDGTHNSLEVARGVAVVRWTAGAPGS